MQLAKTQTTTTIKRQLHQHHARLCAQTHNTHKRNNKKRSPGNAHTRRKIKRQKSTRRKSKRRKGKHRKGKRWETRMQGKKQTGQKKCKPNNKTNWTIGVSYMVMRQKCYKMLQNVTKCYNSDSNENRCKYITILIAFRILKKMLKPRG